MKNFKKFFSGKREIFEVKTKKYERILKISKEKFLRNGLKCPKAYCCEAILGFKCNTLEKIKKTLKKDEKYFKKVLTNGNIYDILHERSTEGRKKQRSLKIEQQQIRTN